jgi:hypothetical protein
MAQTAIALDAADTNMPTGVTPSSLQQSQFGFK